MSTLTKYIIKRFIFFLLTLLIGITILFLISRLTPINPIDLLMSKLSAQGAQITQEQFDSIKNTFMKLYGLDKPLLGQYLSFLQGLSVGDLGPSFSFFPKPVSELIYDSMPWSIGLLATVVLISWIVGNVVGCITGFFSQKKLSKVLEGIFLVLYPMPYVVMALLIVMLFIYFIPIFPYFGGAPIGITRAFSLKYFVGIIRHAFLPAISVILISMGGWFLSMRALTINTKTENFVEFAELRGLPRRKIMFGYVMRNCLLPQITGLALTLGFIFNGSLVTEYIFAYPGIGYLMYYAITNGDLNLMTGIAFFALLAIISATLLVELMLPLIDPRIRYGE